MNFKKSTVISTVLLLIASVIMNIYYFLGNDKVNVKGNIEEVDSLRKAINQKDSAIVILNDTIEEKKND